MSNHDIKIENRSNLNQIRVESCIGTILTIKNKMKDIENIDPVFMFQFNKLESIIPQIKVENITEREVEKIEMATNNLFSQMKSLFLNEKDVKVYDGTKH